MTFFSFTTGTGAAGQKYKLKRVAAVAAVLAVIAGSLPDNSQAASQSAPQSATRTASQSTPSFTTLSFLQLATSTATPAGTGKSSSAPAISQPVLIGKAIQGWNVGVTVDGRQIILPAFLADDALIVPLVPLVRAMGYTVHYKAGSGEFTLTKGHRTIETTLNHSAYKVNGFVSSAKTPFVWGETTYVPLRQIADLSGYSLTSGGKDRYVLKAPVENDLKVMASEALTGGKEPYAFSITYPVVSGWSNQEAMGRINRFLKNEAEKWANQANKELAAAWEAYPHKENLEDYAHVPPYDFQVEWTIASNEGGRLSLYADTNLYKANQDRSARYSWTFDLATGEVMTLAQVLGGSADAVEKVNQRVRLRIASGEVNPPVTAAFQEVGKPGTGWYIEHGGIVVYIDQKKQGYGAEDPSIVRVPLYQIPAL
ncbi:stalk domain-containing protein [Paenibacillus sp. CN-4]|uniref:stalk domain-containing protein n=1 Tax=Paenibacillus nanchangensis TaxID=3348343 RepID=UPI00397A4074